MNQTQTLSLLRIWNALNAKQQHQKVQKDMLQDDLDTMVMLIRRHLPAGIPNPPTHHASTQIHDWLTYENESRTTP